MPARLIDGKASAAALRAMVSNIIAAQGLRPCLATVLVGNDPASEVYIASKSKACAQVAITARPQRLPANTNMAELTALIEQLNNDPAVNGILVQMPLPAPLEASTILAAINPAKDVDGLHPFNAGLLAQGSNAGFIPCTPRGALQLVKSVMPDLAGKRALVIGRSRLVGIPMAHLLLHSNCTVTLAHSHTQNLPELARASDILVAAAGKAGLVQKDWIKPDAVVIDVGITRTATGLKGDVAAKAHEADCWLTPVPGGVGPMTVAGLLANTVIAYLRQNNLPLPAELTT